jgi:K+-sensing histidine kinase KdpD
MRSPRHALRPVLAEAFHDHVNSDQRTDILRALSPGDHLAAVVRSILVLTRTADGGLALELSDVPVRELLGEVHALVKPFAVAAGVSLLIDFERASAAVWGERTALLWALMTLANCVVKSTQRGGIVLLSAAVLLDTVELRVTHMGSDAPSTPLSPGVERMARAVATDQVEIARHLTRRMGGDLLIHGTIDDGGLYALRLCAAWRPPPPDATSRWPRWGGTMTSRDDEVA